MQQPAAKVTPVAGRGRVPSPTEADPPIGYGELLASIKVRVQTAQLRSVLAANGEMVLLYWDLGREISGRMTREGWGTRVVDRLAADLRRAFPDLKGLSLRNLRYMRAFAEAWPDQAIVQQLAAKLPWFHHCVILDRVKDPTHRLFYARQTLEQGWSRNVLAIQIERGLHKRQGSAVTNFARTIPPPGSDLAREALKDPYVFDFLQLADDAHEREIEKALVKHIRDFLIELGVGFAFVGQQVRLEVDGEEFYVDLLFYHLKLRCYVVIELKAGNFKPAYTGQLNFYLTAVDEQLRHPDDKPSIGLLLCKSRSKLVAEYALRDVNKPIGVAEWQTKLVESLPEHLADKLPSVEALQAELDEVPTPGETEE